MDSHLSDRARRYGRVAVLLCLPLLSASGPSAQVSLRLEEPATELTAEVLRNTVSDIATLITREYVDPAIGERVAESLRRRLVAGEYASITTADGLAAQLTRDLGAESQDKHLAVAAVRQPASTAPRLLPEASRADGVRRTNAGVQRVEILSGNVGYLNLSYFWRLEEAREVLADAMRLLRRADALIIDMRQNGGGSPATLALVVGYLLDQDGVPLFDITFRSGDREAFATPSPAPVERDGRRPVFVLTSRRTFSAGEGFVFLLQERGRVVVVGDRTAGAANPAPQPHHVNSLFQVTIPNGIVQSARSGGNWEGRGVTPDLEAADGDALTVAHVATLDRLILATTGEWRVRLGQLRQSIADGLRTPPKN